MDVRHIRGTTLPNETVRDLWVCGDRISVEPLPTATTLHVGGYIIPGLVDAHCRPGTVGIGHPLDDDQLVADGVAHVRAGTAVVHVPGSASRLPAWFGERPDLPRVVPGGLPVAVEGRGRSRTPGRGARVGMLAGSSPACPQDPHDRAGAPSHSPGLRGRG